MHLAKMVQAYIEEHYRESIHSEALCRLTGVSFRTVQRCFRNYFDQTATDYLKTVRLDAARRSLIAAHPSNTTVAKVALSYGFTHLGRFSVHYRERYGESPRETLK
jgi:transcriptional regulator GlxA family with amidase domain